MRPKHHRLRRKAQVTHADIAIAMVCGAVLAVAMLWSFAISWAGGDSGDRKSPPTRFEHTIDPTHCILLETPSISRKPCGYTLVSTGKLAVRSQYQQEDLL